jgi:ABC-type phosphate/phosphonate transport system substrate-binding protein
MSKVKLLLVALTATIFVGCGSSNNVQPQEVQDPNKVKVKVMPAVNTHYNTTPHKPQTGIYGGVSDDSGLEY